MTVKEWMDALTTILGFLVSGLVAFLGTFLTYKSSIKKLNIEKEQMKHEEETAMEKRLKENQEASAARLDSRIEGLEKKVDTKIDNLDTRLDSVQLKLERAQSAYKSMEEKVDTKIGSLEKNVDLKMSIIEKKQDKYNNVIMRQFRTEAAIRELDHDIDVIRQNIPIAEKRAAISMPSLSETLQEEGLPTDSMWLTSDSLGGSQ